MIEVLNESKEEKLNYIINLPDEYGKTEEKFPVILFLHGIGERGADIRKVKKYGIHRYIKDINIPFVVVSPQCKENNFWNRHFSDIEELLENIKEKYRIDLERICLVGVSLGAYGAWNFAMERPNMFKSVVSIAGGAMIPKYANLIKEIPVYIAHGEEDCEVDIRESMEIAEELISIGGKVKLNIVANSGHELCTKIFEDKSLYRWIAENTMKR